MESDIIAELEFHSSLPYGEFVFLTKDNKSDLGFIFADVIAFLLKHNFSMVMVNLSQSVNHYFHLVKKLGVNVKSLEDSGVICKVDVLGSSRSLCTINLKSIYESIKLSINSIIEKNTSNGFLLFVDDISTFLNLGHRTQEVNLFIHSCLEMCFSNDSVPGCLLIGAHDEILDEESHCFMNYLCHLADVNISVRGLDTGYSQDVNGKITVQKKRKKKQSLLTDSHLTNVLFKVQGKGAQFFPLGL